MHDMPPLIEPSSSGLSIPLTESPSCARNRLTAISRNTPFLAVIHPLSVFRLRYAFRAGVIMTRDAGVDTFPFPFLSFFLPLSKQFSLQR
jgi:hypothetical protein